MILVALFVILTGVVLWMWFCWLLLTGFGGLIVLARMLLPWSSELPRRTAEFARDLPYRLRWPLLHLWNVICLRRQALIATVAGFILMAVTYCLVRPPTYSGTCVIKIERDQTEISG